MQSLPHVNVILVDHIRESSLMIFLIIFHCAFQDGERKQFTVVSIL